MAEQIWMLQTKRADFDGIARQFGIDPVTARVIRNRGIEGRENIGEVSLTETWTVCTPPGF